MELKYNDGESIDKYIQFPDPEWGLTLNLDTGIKIFKNAGGEVLVKKTRTPPLIISKYTLSFHDLCDVENVEIVEEPQLLISQVDLLKFVLEHSKSGASFIFIRDEIFGEIACELLTPNYNFVHKGNHSYNCSIELLEITS